jgi:hypothetical protein
LSLYIVKKNKESDQFEEDYNRDTKLNYVFFLIKKGLKSLRSEANGYLSYSKGLVNDEMFPDGFPTTSLHLLKQAAEYNQGDFYSSIIKRYSNNQKLAIENYFQLTSSVQTVLSIKENAQTEYQRFIAKFNSKGIDWKQAMLKLNGIYSKTKNGVDSQRDFAIQLYRIIDSYTSNVNQGNISSQNYSNIRDHLIYPLIKLQNDSDGGEPAYYELGNTIKEMESSINKMQEIQGIAKDHIERLATMMKEEIIKLEQVLAYFEIDIETVQQNNGEEGIEKPLNLDKNPAKIRQKDKLRQNRNK